MKNQGISLITLIITIIVIIILAAIVIFTGLGTPNSANFAHFCQDVDNVQSVVLNSFAELKAKYATANKTRTNEQLYMEVATGSDDVGQYHHMTYDVDTVSAITTAPAGGFTRSHSGDACQHIKSGNKKINNYKLPDVRESNNGWYVTAEGQVFNATGYPYKIENDNYTYFTANVRTSGALNSNKVVASGSNGEYVNRAKAIATYLNGGSIGTLTVTAEN